MVVKLYHQHGCGMCQAIEMMLKKKGIEYESILITTENVDQYKVEGIMGTPTLDVDGVKYFKKECLDWVRGQ